MLNRRIVGFAVFICFIIFKQVAAHEKYDFALVKGWPKAKNVSFGQLSAVAFNDEGNVVVFHRGDHEWDEKSFWPNNTYARIEDGPIETNPVVVLSSATGEYVASWGAYRFYMPHGLTIDGDGNVWVTDVALHQVFKYDSSGEMLLLTLGTQFEPGDDDKHFCKPTSVAILDSGEFFVADGYCNSRIIKYTGLGSKLLQWGTSDRNGIVSPLPSHYSLFVPHALAVVSTTQDVCVADREHGRIICYDSIIGDFRTEYKFPNSLGYRVFSLSYSPADGGKFYVVNGPNYQPPYYDVKAFVISVQENKVEASFGDFKNPHDIAVDTNGDVVYVVEYKPSRVHKFIRRSENDVLMAERQIAQKSTSLIGHIVLAVVVTVIVLMIAAMVYFFKFKKEGFKRYGMIREGGDANESISLVPQDAQD